MPVGMIWPIKRVNQRSFGDRAYTYLTDDNAAKADNHSLAGNFTAHHEAPALIEHFNKLA
jgi:hypothetical protein